jgi:hypothetical protein
MDQVTRYAPPPNPAKATDARYAGYQRDYGNQSWELDALDPTVIAQLIADEMRTIIDDAAWRTASAARDEGRRLLGAVSDNWAKLTKKL